MLPCQDSEVITGLVTVSQQGESESWDSAFAFQRKAAGEEMNLALFALPGRFVHAAQIICEQDAAWGTKVESLNVHEVSVSLSPVRITPQPWLNPICSLSAPCTFSPGDSLGDRLESPERLIYWVQLSLRAVTKGPGRFYL